MAQILAFFLPGHQDLFLGKAGLRMKVRTKTAEFTEAQLVKLVALAIEYRASEADVMRAALDHLYEADAHRISKATKALARKDVDVQLARGQFREVGNGTRKKGRPPKLNGERGTRLSEIHSDAPKS